MSKTENDSIPEPAEKPENEGENPRKESPKTKKTNKNFYVWPIKVFLITLALTLIFSFASEMIIKGTENSTLTTSLILYFVLVFILIAVAIFFDIIAMAVAVCDPAPFYSMASRKIRGAKISLAMLRKADVINSIFSDIIGDVCGIVSGVAAAAIAIKLIELSGFERMAKVLISISVSSIIATVSITAKTVAKRYAMNHSHKIVERTGKALSIFTKSGKPKKQPQKDENLN